MFKIISAIKIASKEEDKLLKGFLKKFVFKFFRAFLCPVFIFAFETIKQLYQTKYLINAEDSLSKTKGRISEIDVKYPKLIILVVKCGHEK